jgi:hypothetical protein
VSKNARTVTKTPPTASTDSTASTATQLRLLPGQFGRREWALDERTRTVGRIGVAAAREILRRHRPPELLEAEPVEAEPVEAEPVEAEPVEAELVDPQPVDKYDKAS